MRGIITVSLDPISYQEELGGPNIVSTVRAAPLPLITTLRSRQLSSSALSLPVSPCVSVCATARHISYLSVSQQKCFIRPHLFQAEGDVIPGVGHVSLQNCQ